MKKKRKGSFIKEVAVDTGVIVIIELLVRVVLFIPRLILSFIK